MVVILTADHTHRAVMLPRWSSIPCCRAVSTWLVSLPPHLLKPQTPARRPLMPWREVTDALPRSGEVIAGARDGTAAPVPSVVGCWRAHHRRAERTASESRGVRLLDIAGGGEWIRRGGREEQSAAGWHERCQGGWVLGRGYRGALAPHACHGRRTRRNGRHHQHYARYCHYSRQ